MPWETNRPGIMESGLAHFTEVGGKTLDPSKLADKDRRALEQALQDIFGTPANPKVGAGEKDQRKALKLDDEKFLEKGSLVYRRHCMHCHGVTGDGRGPTGPWVNPHPRDYRQGLFKFISTATDVDDRKPRRDDIRRTLERGIEGTSMPSFSLLKEEEKDNEKEAVISYVIHLSLRGEVELQVMKPLLDGSGLEGSVADTVKDYAQVYLEKWARSSEKSIDPGTYPYREGDQAQLQASITRGYKIFTDPKGSGSCIACHLDFGRNTPFRYDQWGTLVRPSNLTAGVYRGGRRPIDLYWRVRGGVPPSGMPRADLKVNTAQKTDDYWDLVNFIQALPYPQMLPSDIRDAIYTTRHEHTTAMRVPK
jgi:mono/diheme cytochrome c family protein